MVKRTDEMGGEMIKVKAKGEKLFTCLSLLVCLFVCLSFHKHSVKVLIVVMFIIYLENELSSLIASDNSICVIKIKFILFY